MSGFDNSIYPVSFPKKGRSFQIAAADEKPAETQPAQTKPPVVEKPKIEPVPKKLTKENDPCRDVLPASLEACFDEKKEQFEPFNIRTFDDYLKNRNYPFNIETYYDLLKIRTWNQSETLPEPIEIGKDAIPALVKALRSKEEKVIIGALRVLSKINEKNPETTELLRHQSSLLLHYFNSGNWGAEIHSRKILKNIAEKYPDDLIPHLQGILSKGDISSDSMGSIRLLGFLISKNPEKAELSTILTKLLDSKNTEIEFAAAFTLAYYKLAESSDLKIAKKIVDILNAGINSKSIGWEQGCQALEEMGLINLETAKLVISPLLNIMKGSALFIAMRADDALEKIGVKFPELVIPNLIQAILSNEKISFYKNSLISISKENPKANELTKNLLQEALKNPDRTTREKAEAILNELE